MCGGYTGEHEVDLYSGTYTYEGHDVHFKVSEDGKTVIVTETKDGFETMPVNYTVPGAEKYQSDLIKWGYISY